MDLFLDLETYSSEDLAKSGAYRYAAAPDFKILLLAYAWGDEPVQILDLTRRALPDDLHDALLDPAVVKHAHNANFERVCLARLIGETMPPGQWSCTMARAAAHGLPLSLDGAAAALGLTERKNTEGAALIRLFSKPDKNGHPTPPDWEPARWETFKSYCMQDVEAERQIHKALPDGLMPEERALWILDQEINDRGVGVDMRLVMAAISCDDGHKERIDAEMRELTGMENPGSVTQLKGWLKERGIVPASLGKEDVEVLAKGASDPAVRQVMSLRLDAAKTSVKKYSAMERSVCPDGRIRGTLQFHGARTGRWTGRLVQVQNLPRNYLKSLGDAREMLRGSDFEGLTLFYRSVPDVLSQLIRTAFIPSAGRRFIVSDFSAIEARVIAWLAGERWRMEVFNGHGKIYEASASQMFGVPVESIGKGSPLRQKGKIAELALGFGGAVGALMKMGALNMGLTEEELPEIVRRWRAANPAIVALWKAAETAAAAAVESGEEKGVRGLLRYALHGDFLLCRLPSGRCLHYPYPEVEEERGFKKLSCMEQTLGKWKRERTYGGKLTENFVQAIARDCLAAAMLRTAEAGMEIAFHVHDEIVIDAPADKCSAQETAELMGQPIPWARGLPLRADAYETPYYKKD